MNWSEMFRRNQNKNWLQILSLAWTRVVAAFFLLLMSPLILLICVVILVRDGAPIFFLQERIGQGGQRFKIIKFRTMTSQEPTARLSATHNKRVTHTGKNLRWLKLDELPQLINVFFGEMSFFGPRPELEDYVKDWPSSDRDIILSVRPGLIDPAVLQLVDEEAILAGSADPEQLYRSQITTFKTRIYVEFVENPNITYRNVVLCLYFVRFMIMRIVGKRHRLHSTFDQI